MLTPAEKHAQYLAQEMHIISPGPSQQRSERPVPTSIGKLTPQTEENYR
jgi:hypothetical protein